MEINSSNVVFLMATKECMEKNSLVPENQKIIYKKIHNKKNQNEHICTTWG